MSDRPEGRPPPRRPGRFVAEFVTIVVGVLVALGLESLVTRGVEKAEEEAYVEQLIADLAETERQMVVANVSPQNRTEVIETLLTLMQTGQQVSNDSLRALVLKVQQYNNPVPIFSAADALMDRGRLHLLGPADRSAVARWLSNARDFELEPLYQLEDFYIERASNFRGRVGIPDARPPASVEFSRIPSGQNLQHLMQDDEAYSALIDLLDLHGAMRGYRDRVMAASAELRSRLERISGNDEPPAESAPNSPPAG